MSALWPTKESLLQSCYWVEWIIEFDRKCRKKKEPIYCERRSFIPVQSKYQTDVIWIVWDLILTKTKKNTIGYKCIDALLNLFSLRYNWNAKKKRRYILYFALELIMEKPQYNIEIMNNTEHYENMESKH